jgi:hypothetical protein
MDLDLNIKNYKVSDLEKFFKLPMNYSPTDFKTNVNEIYNTIKNSEMDDETKDNVLRFIEEAKNALSAKSPIVEKPPITYASAKVEEFVEGKMNPIEKRSTTKTICIDTLFRPNYTRTKSTDFTYVLPMPINKVVSLQMTSLEIPNMWNSFSAINHSNTFMIDLFNVNDGSGNIIEKTSTTITIPPGNYMSSEFQRTMNNIFQSEGTPGLNFINLEVSIQTNTIIRANSLEYDTSERTNIQAINVGYELNGPYPYDPSGAYYSPNFYFTLHFEIPNQKLYKTAGWMMGFRQPSYTAKTTIMLDSVQNKLTEFRNYLISESSYGSTIDNYVFLEVTDFHNNYPTDLIVSTNETSYLGNNILARIVLLSGANTIVWNNAGDLIFKKREYFGPVRLEKLHIRILNRFGDVLDLRGNDFSLVLEIKQLY